MEYVVGKCGELSVNYGGLNYLVIYGPHVNGWFCSIPNHQISCELGKPSDCDSNAEKLYAILGDEECAQHIACAIQIHAESVRSQPVFDNFIQHMEEITAAQMSILRNPNNKSADFTSNYTAALCASALGQSTKERTKFIELASIIAQQELKEQEERG